MTPGTPTVVFVRNLLGFVPHPQPKSWVVDIDIRSFFDEVNHDLLLHQISREVTDKRVLGLIRKYLKTGIMMDGKIERRGKGVPQGSPLSPLLADIYLDILDKELEKRDLSFCRYADDLTVYAGSERSAKLLHQRFPLLPVNHAALANFLYVIVIGPGDIP